MRLITYDQIKMSTGKYSSILVTCTVNASDHGLVCGEHTSCIIIALLLHQIRAGQVFQHIHKTTLCLSDKRISICKKQNILHPSGIYQYLTKCYHRSCLTRTCSHDKQCFSSVLLVKCIAHCFYRCLLIIASGNCLIHSYVSEACPHGPQIKPLLQIPLGVNARTLSLWILSINNMCLKPICKEDNRSSAILSLNAVCILLRLISACLNSDTCLLCLYNSKWSLCIIIEHIVHPSIS